MHKNLVLTLVVCIFTISPILQISSPFSSPPAPTPPPLLLQFNLIFDRNDKHPTEDYNS